MLGTPGHQPHPVNSRHGGRCVGHLLLLLSETSHVSMALTLDLKVTDGGDVGRLWIRTVGQASHQGLATALVHALMLRMALRKKDKNHLSSS